MEWKDFRDRIHNISKLPRPTAGDLEYEKDPEGYEHREMAKAWKEELRQFNRLKHLAFALGINEVIVSSPSVRPDLQGLYWDTWTSEWHPARGWRPSLEEFELAKEWGLSKKRIRSLNRRGALVILLNFWTERGGCYVLAHEIGHHIYQLALFSFKEQKRPVQRAIAVLMYISIPRKVSAHEMCAECFAEYLTCTTLRCGVAKHCETILHQVRLHKPSAAKLIESYRSSRVA